MRVLCISSNAISMARSFEFSLAEKPRFSALLRPALNDIHLTPITHLTMTTSQCAVGPDGELLDASKIDWYHDPDDDCPLPSVSSAVPVTPGSSAVTSSDPKIHPFFQSKGLPAAIVAGSRRSTRAIRPSTRLIDPNNVEATTSTRQKRSRQESLPRRRTSRKILESDAESSEYNETLPLATDAAETTAPDDDGDGSMLDEHTRLQTMADADHEVSHTYLF
jgi:hypothetical protein